MQKYVYCLPFKFSFFLNGFKLRALNTEFFLELLDQSGAESGGARVIIAKAPAGFQLAQLSRNRTVCSLLKYGRGVGGGGELQS